MIKYIKLDKSNNLNKKFVAVFYDENKKKIKTTHFGSAGMSDYTINNDNTRKELYLIDIVKTRIGMILQVLVL